MAEGDQTPFDVNRAEGRVARPQARMVRLSAVELRAP
jgi:hypothetical protein